MTKLGILGTENDQNWEQLNSGVIEPENDQPQDSRSVLGFGGCLGTTSRLCGSSEG